MKIVAEEEKRAKFWAVRRRGDPGTGSWGGGGPAEGGGKIELAKVGIRQSRAGQNGPQSQGSGFRVSGLGFSFHGVRLFRVQGEGGKLG